MLVDLDEAVKILNDDGVVAFPTETVYGLGADATSQKAVAKVYKIKNRPRDNPLICHFYNLKQIRDFVPELPKVVEILIKHFSPGPFSALVNMPLGSPLLPATCGLPSVIVRIPDHPTTLNLIQSFGRPIVGPSANTSGKFSGTDPEMIEADLGSKIGGILDGGRSKIGLESTIIDFRVEGKVKILRQGAIGQSEILSVLRSEGLDVEVVGLNSKVSQLETTPGSRYKHYAPDTPIFRLEDLKELTDTSKMALLTVDEYFSRLFPSHSCGNYPNSFISQTSSGLPGHLPQERKDQSSAGVGVSTTFSLSCHKPQSAVADGPLTRGNNPRTYGSTPLRGVMEGTICDYLEGVKKQERDSISLASTVKCQNLQIISLGSVSDLAQVAQNLYRNLYELDKLRVEKAFLYLPELGPSSLARAIEDKLKKIVS